MMGGWNHRSLDTALSPEMYRPSTAMGVNMHGERVVVATAAHWDANEVVGEAKAASQMAPSVNMYELEYTVAGPESMETRKVLPCRPHLWTSERELTEEELAQQE